MGDQLRESAFPFLAQLSADGRSALATIPVGGSLRVYYITAQGREATLYHVETGGTCVLALTAAFKQKPYPAWVEAGPDGGRIVCVPLGTFQRLLDSERAFRDFVFGALSDRVFELMRTLEETGSALMEQRVARYLLRSQRSDGTVRTTQAAIAAELGTAREVVFRALRSLADRRLVQTGRMTIRVLDAARLQRVAEADFQPSE